MMRTFTTNLRCGNCVSKVKPGLDSAGWRWSVDLASPERTLTIDGESIDAAQVRSIVADAGFEARENAAPIKTPTSYYPLLLIVGYLLGITLLVEAARGSFDPMRAMGHFMAGFFLAFSFFKLLDLKSFADSYAMYDLLAARSRVYALAYPFLELALGIAYLVGFAPMATNAVTLVFMLLGTAGVLNALRQKRQVKCACLGNVINLPMSWVTLIEDATMAAMAATMLVIDR